MQRIMIGRLKKDGIDVPVWIQPHMPHVEGLFVLHFSLPVNTNLETVFGESFLSHGVIYEHSFYRGKLYQLFDVIFISSYQFRPRLRANARIYADKLKDTITFLESNTDFHMTKNYVQIFTALLGELL